MDYYNLSLQEAQKMVDFILRHGNDLLAVECLRGYEVRSYVTNPSPLTLFTSEYCPPLETGTPVLVN